jgi:hypothetical protein
MLEIIFKQLLNFIQKLKFLSLFFFCYFCKNELPLHSFF